MFYSWIKLNFFYLIVVAFLGLLMRLLFVGIDILPYNNILHAHSHTAFLGWVYPLLFILLINTFLDKSRLQRFKTQLILTQIMIPAMLIAFLAQGYGFYSIFFSSLFQFLNYWFIFSLLSELKNTKSTFAKKFLKIALWSLFASTFGPWALAIIKVAGLHTSNWYKMAIYFYLHFQYNGWILFALFALFFKSIEKYADKDAGRFLNYMAWSLIPAYFLSLLDLFVSPWNFSLAAVAALLQVQALYFLLRFIMKTYRPKEQQAHWATRVLSIIVLFSFSIKILLQFLSVFPDLTQLAFNNHNIIISFIHLIMLGVISSYIFVLLDQTGILTLKQLIPKIGVIFFVMGFILSELFLAFRFTGILFFSNPFMMIAFILLILAGLLFIYTGFFKGKRNGTD